MIAATGWGIRWHACWGALDQGDALACKACNPDSASQNDKKIPHGPRRYRAALHSWMQSYADISADDLIKCLESVIARTPATAVAADADSPTPLGRCATIRVCRVTDRWRLRDRENVQYGRTGYVVHKPWKRPNAALRCGRQPSGRPGLRSFPQWTETPHSQLEWGVRDGGDDALFRSALGAHNKEEA